MDIENKSTKKERTIIEGVFYYLGIILQYKILIIIITAVFFSAVLAFLIISLKLSPETSPLPNVYKSQCIIRLQVEKSSLSADSLMASMGISNGKSSESDISQVVTYILNSGAIIDQLVDEFRLIEKLGIQENVKAKSRYYVRSKIATDFNEDTGFLTIGFYDTNPIFSRDFVNRAVELLQKWFIEEGGSVKSRQIELLNIRMTETLAKIRDIEGDIKNFQTKYGVLSITDLAEQQSSMLNDLQTKLVQVDLEIKQYSQYSRIEDPGLARLKVKRENILSIISDIENGYVVNGRKLPSKRELSDLSAQYSRLSLDLKIQNDIYQTLAQRHELLRISAIEETVFSVLEWGEIPEIKIGPNRSQILIMGTLFGFIFSIVLIFAIHFLKIIFRDPEKTKFLKYN